MTIQQTSDGKKGFLQNDTLLVCSILVFYGLCIVGLIGTAAWFLNDRRNQISANATSTANAVSTQQAHATATAAAMVEQQDQYEYIERFEDADTARWYTGPYDSTYGDASFSIENGVYAWDIVDPEDHILSVDFYKGSSARDFDMYMDVKFQAVSPDGDTCSGFVFRKSSLDWDGGAFIFAICEASYYEIYYYSSTGWETIFVSNRETIINPDDWNRIAISARGNHYTFAINHQTVYEMDDDRRKTGAFGIYVDIDGNNSGVIWFDNFGFQSR